MTTARKPGSGLIFAGTILSVIGVCIIAVEVWNLPGYWVPLMVGLGLILIGLIRRATTRPSGGDPR